MRAVRRIGLALLMALAFTTPAAAQPAADRFVFNAAVGPSFANLGTTFSTTAGLDVALNDRTAIVGEFGLMPHAPFRDASEIAPAPGPVGTPSRVNAYHWNGNLKVQPLRHERWDTYVTGGVGSFIADTVVDSPIDGVDTLRRAADFATNVGGGVRYHLNDWVGVGADYRTFFVHRDDDTTPVNRFTAGLTFSVR